MFYKILSNSHNSNLTNKIIGGSNLGSAGDSTIESFTTYKAFNVLWVLSSSALLMFSLGSKSKLILRKVYTIFKLSSSPWTFSC